MDAQIPLAGLISQFNSLVEAGDFEGGEELLFAGFSSFAEHGALLHLQMGKLYRRWNKLSSAVHHLNRAVEMAAEKGDQILILQIVEELKGARAEQTKQRP